MNRREELIIPTFIVIERLIRTAKDDELDSKTIKSLRKSLDDIEKGKTYPLAQVEKELDLVEELAKRDNPILGSIMKVENLFREHIEFDSKSQLLRKLDGSMKASSLDTIIACLVDENKIIVNDDHTLTWIDTKENKKLDKQFDSAMHL
ncbi:MAG: hypothetical protein ACREA7_08315 [Nitrosotalea sp.]